MNKFTEGKRYVGVIVGGGDKDPDPKKMGRVRVAIPQLMNPNIDPKTLPWSQLASTANHTGGLSFDRPPQEGTMVSIYFPPGSKNSLRGIVELVYNNMRKEE